MQKKTGSVMGGRLLQHAVCMEVYVLSPMHLSAEACRVRGLTAFKTGFPADHAHQHQWQHYTETDDVKNEWQSLQSTGVHFEDYRKRDSAFKVCGFHT
jgi:hypothetical protein